VSLSLTIDALNSAPARLNQETLEQALSRLSQELQAKGSALVE
jgi:glycine cleavage system regulatory protein